MPNLLQNIPSKSHTEREYKNIIHEGREYLHSSNFARKYNFSSNEIYLARKQGMPHIIVGRTFYYNIEDCEKWHRGEYP
ncbi:MAG: hypothetical protein FWB96_01365 [Defluviitaleaceae bacterium]|nr:hypothetical protein [Defluviitaleaceae bacterium]MCL2261658.1 hypothetical protein [Defluviitaleaceae bacterium]